jgi:hypothetical protein
MKNDEQKSRWDEKGRGWNEEVTPLPLYEMEPYKAVNSMLCKYDELYAGQPKVLCPVLHVQSARKNSGGKIIIEQPNASGIVLFKTHADVLNYRTVQSEVLAQLGLVMPHLTPANWHRLFGHTVRNSFNKERDEEWAER